MCYVYMRILRLCYIMSWQIYWAKQTDENCVLQTNDATKITQYKIPFDIDLKQLTIISKSDIRGLARFYLYNNNDGLWTSDRIQLKRGVKHIDIDNVKLRAGFVIKLVTTNNIPTGTSILLSGITPIQINHQSYWQAYLKTKGTIHQISGKKNVDLLYAPMFEKTKITHISISSQIADINGGIEIILGTGRTVMTEDPTKKNEIRRFVVANENPMDKSTDLLYPIPIIFENAQFTQSIDISSKNIIIETGHCLYIESMAWLDNKRIQQDLKTSISIGIFHIHIIGITQ